MRKLLNSPWFVALLALAAVAVVGQKVFYKPARPAPPAAAGEPPTESAPVNEETSPRLSVAAALQALAIPTTVRNPFAFPAKSEESAPDRPGSAVIEIIHRLRLSAVWVQGPAVLLLLNGQIYQPGDTVAPFTVETADVDGAWVRYPGGRSLLTVGHELVVKTTAPGPLPLLSPSP